jgi:acyl-CoA thioesterase I
MMTVDGQERTRMAKPVRGATTDFVAEFQAMQSARTLRWVGACLFLVACTTSNGGGGTDAGARADGAANLEGGGPGDGAASADSNTESGDGAASADSNTDAPGGNDGGACGSGAASIIKNPNPIISRAAQGGQAFASPSANASQVNNGIYHNGGWSAGMPTVSAPAWVAIKLAAPATRVLLSWDDGGTYNYQDPTTTPVYGLPANYEIDVSADSTNGSDGTWTVATDAAGNALTITGNQVRTRAHSFAFTGMSWVKMVITAAPPNISGNGVQIGEIDVHDISAAGGSLPDDTWFFMGDSITAFAFDRAQVHQPSFAKTVSAESTAFFPAMINGGIGSEQASSGLARLQNALALNPDYRFFVLGYGTNDSALTTTAVFQTNMQKMIDMVKAAGRAPVIPHIPWAGGHGAIPQFNAVIDQLVQTNQLAAGPDLYGYFLLHSGDAGTNDFVCPPCAGGRATDNLHPNDVGLTAINTLWAQAVCPLYP